MKSPITYILILLLLLVTIGSIAQENNTATDSTRNAEGLLQDAERAIALIVKSGQQTNDPKLQRENKDSEPFWGSVKKLNSNIDKLNKYHFLKDETFHKTLAETVTAKEEVKTTYELLEASDTGVMNGITKVSTAVDLLYQNYSKEAVRMKQGGELSTQEKAELAKIIEQNKTIQLKLDELEKKAEGNEKMLKKLKKIRKKSNEVVHCHHNSAGFFFAMSAMHMINGWMWGCHWWWGPWGGWYPGFYVGYMDIYVGVIDDYAYDWGYLDGVIDTYDYDLDVEMDELEIDTMDEYLNDIEVDTMDEYPIDSGMQDGTMDLYDFDQQDFAEPMPMDIAEPSMNDFQQFDQSDFMDSGMDYDFGGFDYW